MNLEYREGRIIRRIKESRIWRRNDYKKYKIIYNIEKEGF